MLDSPRPTELLEVVRQLTFVQIEPRQQSRRRQISCCGASSAIRLTPKTFGRRSRMSRRGTVVAPVHRPDVAPGQVFLDFHFPEVVANVMTSGVADDVTSCPEYRGDGRPA